MTIILISSDFFFLQILCPFLGRPCLLFLSHAPLNTCHFSCQGYQGSVDNKEPRWWNLAQRDTHSTTRIHLCCCGNGADKRTTEESQSDNAEALKMHERFDWDQFNQKHVRKSAPSFVPALRQMPNRQMFSDTSGTIKLRDGNDSS